MSPYKLPSKETQKAAVEATAKIIEMVPMTPELRKSILADVKIGHLYTAELRIHSVAGRDFAAQYQAAMALLGIYP